MNALEAQAVTKAYGSQAALKGVDLAIQAGVFCALLGPNGAGKTTLFQILSGLFSADSGSATLLGCDVARQAEALRQLGCVFQQPSLDLDMTVQRNLSYHASLHGLSHRETLERSAAVLDSVGLAGEQQRLCRQLSGGNRRKVELARALLHRPKVLLMDEATVGLDPQSRQQLLALVHDLCKKEDLTVLWATHLVEEVQDAPQVVVLVRGQVTFNGTPEGLQHQQRASTLTDAFLSLTEAHKGETR